MAEFDYSPFDRDLKISFVCPHCGRVNNIFVRTPEPDWNYDSHSESINSEVEEKQSDNCGRVYNLTMATGISGGLGIMQGVEEIEVVVPREQPEIEEKAREEIEEKEREEFEEKDSLETIVPPSDIIAFNEMRSCADIYRMYTSGQIDIQPDFQRGIVWSRRAQTLFVDSVLKQLPIPSICISLDSNTQKRLVIDGLQRISTMIKFLTPDSNWLLSSIEDVDKRIRGKRVGEIRQNNPNLISVFENFVIPITVIRCDYNRHDHMQYLFQIFNRLNSGGSKLYNQEIRNCIYQGPFNTLIKKLARSQEWCSFADVTPERVLQSRFGHEERILRFFAFNERWSCYPGRFAAFLNDYMETYKNCTSIQIEKFKNLFFETMMISNKIDDRRITKVVADAVLVGVAHNLEKLRTMPDEEINMRFQSLMQLDDFSTVALSQGLSQKDKVVTRIKRAIEFFGRD